MKFSSLVNPQIRSLEELIVFCYEDRRVLLPLPPSYVHAERVAREVFELDTQEEIVFETTDLAGCGDLGPVEIREAAWSGIAVVLSKISVRCKTRSHNTAVVAPRFSLRQDGNKHLQSIQNEVTFEKHVSASSSTRRSLVAPLSALNTTSQTSVRSGSGRKSGEASTLVGSSAFSKSSGRVSAAPRPSVNVPEEDELDDDDMFSNPSPSKRGRSTRQLILSDTEDEEAAEEDEDYDRVHKDEAHSAEDEEEEAAVEKEVVGEPKEASPRPAEPQKPQPEIKVKEEKIDIAAEVRKLSISVAKAEAEDKTRSGTKVPLTAPDLQSLLEPLDSLEKTFLITVDFDDGDPEGPRSSTFKTKGRHTVHKVLYTVCRTFGVEDYYQQAHLALVIEEEIGNDKFIEHRFKCAREDTMAAAGARPDARFLLIIDEDEEE